LQTFALDVAAGSGKSLEAVTNAMARAAEGNTTALGKLGVGLTAAQLKTMSMDEVTKALADTFGGQAAAKADTFQGKMARLTVSFNEAKETVGSYVLDALTPLLDGFVNKGIPAIQGFADSLGQSLGPAFASIFKVIKEDLLPILTSWWKFLSGEVIPAIATVVKPILEGLSFAFNTIKKSIADNSEELKPFIGFLKTLWTFISEDLAPLLGGTFKVALQGIGYVVAALVTSFSNLVGFVTATINKIKEFVNYVKNNPVTQFFFGDSGSKGLKASGSLGTTDPVNPYLGTVAKQNFFYDPINGDPRTFTGAPLEAFSGGMQAAILRKNALVAETASLRAAREAAAAARSIATGGLSTAERITINVSGAIDPEGTARTIVDTLNDSYYRGTNGASNLVGI
jgi:hypothetical protein